MITLTKSMAVEWGKHNIQVNGLGPGYFSERARYVAGALAHELRRRGHEVTIITSFFRPLASHQSRIPSWISFQRATIDPASDAPPFPTS